MRILVLSDSHGCVENMARAVEREQPREIWHLGDCVHDAEQLRQLFPNIPLESVPGNCDYAALDQPERLLEREGCRVLLMHGHTRRVKGGPLAAVYAARECGADILLFGHTHQPLVDRNGPLWIMNPGSIGRGLMQTYGLILLENGRVDCTTRRL